MNSFFGLHKYTKYFFAAEARGEKVKKNLLPKSGRAGRFFAKKKSVGKIFLRKGLFIKKQYFNFAPQFAKETIKKIITI